MMWVISSFHDKSDYCIAFPQVPGHRLRLRAFGLYKQDLDINFEWLARPYLVTHLLHICSLTENGDVPDPSVFWDLTIGKRIQSIFLLTMIGNDSDLTIPIVCKNQLCAKMMEVDISQMEIADLQSRADAVEAITIPLKNRTLSLRKPKGLDQMQWLDWTNKDSRSIKHDMIRDLLLESSDNQHPIPEEIDEDWFIKFDHEMEIADPLPHLTYTIRCPHCNDEDHYPVDLEDSCLVILQRKQKQLLRTIHRLAVHYHWSENEILSIPPWRRSRYLDHIEKA